MRAPRPWRWLSRLPPCRPAQPFAISSPPVATPTTPTIGRARKLIRSFILTVSPSTSNTNVTGASTSSINWPNSGMIVAKPFGPGRTSSNSTTSESPGCAPFTATGPVSLFTREKSIDVTRSSSDWICPVKQSFVSKVTTAPGSTSSTGSSSGPKPQITSSRETRCSVATAISAAILLPGRRIAHPAPAGHRRYDLAAVQVFDRISREHDEVCEETREELPAPPLVSAEPRRRHACGDKRLLDGHRLLRVPRRPLVDRPRHARANARERVELLDRGVRPVGDDGAGLEQRTERVGAVCLLRPEAVGKVAIRRRVRELHRRRDSEPREPRQVLRRKTLRVLDARAQSLRRPLDARRLKRVERVSVRAVADRVHGDRPADARGAADDLLELLPARDLDARTVQHACGLGAEGPVHECLQVAGTQPVVTEPGAKVDCLERVETLVRQRLPHAHVEDAFAAQPLEEAEVAEPAVLVVHGRDAARDGEAETCAHRVQPLLVGDLREDETAAELPRRLLAEDAARLAALVELDDAARYLQVAVRRRERRGVEPQRMSVFRHQGRGC